MFNRAGRFNKQPFNRRRIKGEVISIVGGIECFVEFDLDFMPGISFTSSIEVEVDLVSDLRTGFKHYATIPSDVSFPQDIIYIRGDSLVVDGFDIIKDGAFLTREFRLDALPERKNKYVTIPGRHGQVDLGFKLDRRLLEPTIHIESTDCEQLERAKEDLVARFSKKPLKLILTRWPTKMYYAEYSSPIPLQQWFVDAQVDIPFKMSDPYVYNTSLKYGVGGEEIVNEGEPTHYTIQLLGPSFSPAIIIGDYTFYYVGEIPVGSFVTFDTRTMTAWMGGQEVTRNFVGEIPMLPTGNVQLETSTGFLVLEYRERWSF
jgi:phage-related protein